jgi:CRP-like cAMP-binding protein
MIEAAVVSAFFIGILSASSLFIGAVTSFYWRPGDRFIAFIMALGGGALLAALTLDLVNEALHRGDYFPLCIGCLAGGLLFISLDYVVSDYGGFMRKAATTVFHVRRQEHRQYKKILSHIGRTDIFRHLQTHHYKHLSGSIKSHEFKKGEIVYQPGDPSDELYIALTGEVELFYPEKEHRASRKVVSNQAFGRLSFHTGAPNVTGAQVMSDTAVLKVPRSAFNALLLNSTTMQQVMHRWLRGKELLEHLKIDYKMGEADAKRWIDEAVQSLINRGKIPPALAPLRQKKEFIAICNRICRVSLFQRLPPDETDAVASCLLYKHYEKGQPLFRSDDIADRMYIIDRGSISLINSQALGRRSQTLGPHFAIGASPLISGSRHTSSAIVTRDVDVWVLRKAEFTDLLRKTRIFRERVAEFLRQDDFGSYLQTQLHFDPDKSSRFIQSCLKAIDQGNPLPSADAMSHNPGSHGGAAIAIWLGIMLDGIPESLVIGSSMIHAKISLSLMVGLFISNFPEALSSSIGMRRQGIRPIRILLMWTSIVLMTGIGAAIGNSFFAEADPVMFTLLEGTAAGAMLTMLAQTMLPEAYFKGGSIVGFATLLGFLAAIIPKSL